MPANTQSIPLISIILCTHNGEKFLQAQLDSLLKQMHENIEILVFDDASRDTTIQIIKDYKKQHFNISLFTHNQCLGFITNFEQAIVYWLKHGNSDYIALCDQDDVWHPDKLTQSLDALITLETLYPRTPALVHSDLRLINANNQPIHSSFFASKNLNFSNEKSLSKLLGYNGVMGNTLLINRHLAKICIPFPHQLKYHDYWISVINELFGKRATIQHPLIDYRLHDKNTSNNRQPKSQGRQSIFQLTTSKKLAVPFFCDQRKPLIHYLLQNFPNLREDDRMLLLQFQRYLKADMSRMEAFIFLFKNGFLKQKWSHKISVCFRLLVMRKESH
ncbi:MAG: glycosyltransferase family 2 protein [Cocleimonas sp.]|nr:glycosyltransferase family 2 protein [Cocleimonas sp.]